jgi:adenosyl cobinamide kinase/adenosyl cobinamide phosphate guanylyltransferase
LHGIGDGAVGGEDQHRQQRMAAVHRLEQLQAVHAAHAQVGDQQLRQLVVQHAQRRLAAGRFHHVVALGAQAHRQQPQQGGVVVDDQDAGHGRLFPWRPENFCA